LEGSANKAASADTIIVLEEAWALALICVLRRVSKHLGPDSLRRVERFSYSPPTSGKSSTACLSTAIVAANCG
jgi:hypothetical protein